MEKDTGSIAPSEATTFVSEPKFQERTTLMGKPIEYKHDNFTNMMMGDGAAGMAFGAAGANLLPPGYTDKSLVRIPIKMTDIDGVNPVQPAKKKGLFRKMSSSSASDGEIKVVMMSRGDYLKYWAKGDDGKYLPTVQEPPGGRKAWFENQLEVNKEWRMKDPSL